MKILYVRKAISFRTRLNRFQFVSVPTDQFKIDFEKDMINEFNFFLQIYSNYFDVQKNR